MHLFFTLFTLISKLLGTNALGVEPQGSIAGELVSPAASFTSQRSTRSLAPGLEAAVTLDASVHDSPSGQSRSASRTRSQSREAEAHTATSPAADLTADEADVMGDEADDAAADGMQSVTWGASISQSELVDMFLTGRTASSRSATRRRKVCILCTVLLHGHQQTPSGPQ